LNCAYSSQKAVHLLRLVKDALVSRYQTYTASPVNVAR
jgi:hypothetical protein